MSDRLAHQGRKRAIARAAGALLGPPYRRARRLIARRPLDLSRDEVASAIRKVLVVRLDAIGDVLLSEPALEVLRNRFPRARIDLVANPDSAAVLEGTMAVDRIIAYRAPWHAVWRGAPVAWHREAGRLLGLTAALWREAYDVGFELRGDARDIAFLAAAAPRSLAGSSFRGAGGLLDYDVPQGSGAHQVDLAVAVAAAGMREPPRARPPRVHPTPGARARAERLLAAEHAQRSPIALHLGAGFPSKCLPVETFASVVHQLAGEVENLLFVVVGTSGERRLGDQLGLLVPEAAVLNLAGDLTLLETAAVLGRCRLFVGNDSAPMHLAAAAGTPVVTFFGPSEPWKFHPYGVPYRLLEVSGLDCRPCDYVHCVWPPPLQYQCMTRQSTGAIAAAARELLALTTAARPAR